MKYSIFYILFISVIFTSCDPIDKKLSLFNKSKSDIYYTISGSDKFMDLYLDDFETSNIQQNYLNYIERLPSDSTTFPLRFGDNEAWERYINFRDDSLIRIVTFDLDSLKTISWKKIIKEKKFKRIYKYSISDLEKMNWKVELSE